MSSPSWPPPMATARGVPHVSVGFSGALSDKLQAVLEAGIAPVWEMEGAPRRRRHQWRPVAASASLPARYPSYRWPVGSDAAPLVRRRIADRSARMGGGFRGEPPRNLRHLRHGARARAAAPWESIFEALGDRDVDVVVTTGRGLDPDALGSPPPNLRVEPYVPQSLLIDRSSIVVSHAGAGDADRGRIGGSGAALPAHRR
ncbi:MAG: hypothetical protein R2695_12785 [Acidimicrobiales bacterium]